MNFLVRPAAGADADALGRVHVACWRETYAHLLSVEALAGLSAQDWADRWRGVIAGTGEFAQFVAESDGAIVGFSGIGPGRDADSPRELELYTIHLLAAHHGTGAGQALLDAAVGSHAAFLWVAEDNPRAQGFYRRNGFVADGTRKVETILGEDLAEIRMAR